jgi:hypothetical protein
MCLPRSIFRPGAECWAHRHAIRRPAKDAVKTESRLIQVGSEKVVYADPENELT